MSERKGRVEGKVAIVTGAASGLGAAAAKRLAAEGASVMLTDIAEAGRAVADEIEAAAGGGSVINMSSVMGKVAFPGAAAYCASKGGVALLTKAAALEWAPLGIRVNSVHPGFIDTPMVSGVLQQMGNANELRSLVISRHALGRLGVASEIGDAVLFLASDESSFMTGSELIVDGGYTAQ